MTEKIKELLAVLDRPEDLQKSWCWFNIESVHDAYYDKRDVSLADLAFRLRDEAVNDFFRNALVIICRKIIHLFPLRDCPAAERVAMDWLGCNAQPIHWIIAALIAKELAKSGKTNGSTKS